MNKTDRPPQRRSLRLPTFDYASHGAYFVTIVIQNRPMLFGDVIDGAVAPTDAGRMLEGWWHKLVTKFERAVELDEFVVMPNHIHGIIGLTKAAAVVGAAPSGCPAPSAVSLPTVVGWYKTMTTNAYVRGVRDAGWPLFAKRLWQRGYYEHVVRDDDDLNRIRQYIIDNPARWSEDEEHPDAQR